MSEHLSTETTEDLVRVIAPARIHCGLLNESGLFGRIDGGIGFSIANPYWTIDVSTKELPNQSISLCLEHERAINYVLDRFKLLYKVDNISISISDSIPIHAGLGSKTSLMLGVGYAIAKLFSLPIAPFELAKIVGRGSTSGIGVHSFFSGGFVWDFGRKFPESKQEFSPSSSSCLLPPREILHLPVDWLKVIHFRFDNSGPHGLIEKNIFKHYCPIPESETRHTLSVVSGALIPALFEKDEELLQNALRCLQHSGFKQYEWLHQGDTTKGFKAYWDSCGSPIALGLSSMGPSMYCLTHDTDKVLSLLENFDGQPLQCTVSEVCSRRIG
jgi:beta-ribofuranosylaminobenzene 5'-phosphate synthase